MFFSTFHCIRADDVTGNRYWVNVAVSYRRVEYCRGVCCAQDKIRMTGFGGWKGLALELGSSSAGSWDSSCCRTAVKPKRDFSQPKK